MQTRINKLKQKPKIHVSNIKTDQNVSKFANLTISTEAQNNQLSFQENIILELQYTIP